MQPERHYDVVVIGAGPAGLAAAHDLRESGLSIALVDSGKTVQDRDRHRPDEATRGHGGAGLYSDGKFSFFPSATELWELPERAALKYGYRWTCDVLNRAGLDTPPFPSDSSDYTPGGWGEWVIKDYPSDYLSLDARVELVERLVAEIAGDILDRTTVVAAEKDALTTGFRLRLAATDGFLTTVRCRRLIVATGRFGPLGLRSLTTEKTFQRLEIGFRITQPAGDAFFREMPQLDPKLRFRREDGAVEWRTFCACRNGETVLTETGGLWTVSGRADCPCTGESNIGFNTRVLDRDVASTELPRVLHGLRNRENYFEVPLQDALAGRPAATDQIDAAYGPVLRAHALEGLRRLHDEYGGIAGPGARLVGPTLEGVGWYPVVDGTLKLTGSPAWVAGDACGLFRGIIAALISGVYAARSVLSDITKTATPGRAPRVA